MNHTFKFLLSFLLTFSMTNALMKIEAIYDQKNNIIFYNNQIFVHSHYLKTQGSANENTKGFLKLAKTIDNSQSLTLNETEIEREVEEILEEERFTDGASFWMYTVIALCN